MIYWIYLYLNPWTTCGLIQSYSALNLHLLHYLSCKFGHLNHIRNYTVCSVHRNIPYTSLNTSDFEIPQTKEWCCFLLSHVAKISLREFTSRCPTLRLFFLSLHSLTVNIVWRLMCHACLIWKAHTDMYNSVSSGLQSVVCCGAADGGRLAVNDCSVLTCHYTVKEYICHSAGSALN